MQGDHLGAEEVLARGDAGWDVTGRWEVSMGEKGEEGGG